MTDNIHNISAISAKEAQGERLADFIKVLKAQDGKCSQTIDKTYRTRYNKENKSHAICFGGG